MNTTTFNLMTPREVSEALRVPEGTLRYWRHVGTGPKFLKIGARKVMYRRADLEEFLDARVTEAAR